MRIRTVAVVLLVVVAVVGLSCYGAWRLLLPAALKPAPPMPECVARAGGTAKLTPEQMANAATVAAVGVRRRLPVRAVQIALVTAMQESKLRNLSGGDRDSVGLFQQRPSQGWGAPDQLMDERFAAGAFYAALVKIPGWQTMDVGDAAQAVQHSAYPEAYAQWSDLADVLARALTGGAERAVACTLAQGAGAAAGSAPPGAAAADSVAAGLRADWGVDAVPTGAGGAEVAVAASDAVAGWRYAYWLVSHAEEFGVDRVGVLGQTWTAKDGRWTGASATAASGGPVRVVATVHTGR